MYIQNYNNGLEVKKYTNKISTIYRNLNKFTTKNNSCTIYEFFSNIKKLEILLV